jgi:hypothetical protein
VAKQSLYGNLASNWLGLAQFYLTTKSANAFRTVFEDPNRSLDIKFIVPAFLVTSSSENVGLRTYRLRPPKN